MLNKNELVSSYTKFVMKQGKKSQNPAGRYGVRSQQWQLPVLSIEKKVNLNVAKESFNMTFVGEAGYRCFGSKSEKQKKLYYNMTE